MNYTEWIGYAAASLTTASFVPQAWLTFKTRDVSGISLGDVQRIHPRHCAVVGLRLANRSLARGDCQRHHVGLGCQYFDHALALWTQGINR